MAKKTLRDLADTDLLERFNETKEELFNLRFQLATGQPVSYTHLTLPTTPYV